MRITKTLLLLGIVAAFTIGACILPAAARSPTISDIQPGDVIFVYETGLNLTDLRDQTTNNPITELRQYRDGDTSKAAITQIPVSDDTDFSVMEAFVPKSSVPMTVWAWNPTDGNTNSVMIYYPEVSIEAVLASSHADSVTGLSIPDGTSIAFRVTSPQVGSYYYYGPPSTWPAKIDILLTMPGGAQTTNIGGTNLAGMSIDSAQFYTNDPGKPGGVILSFKDQGTYTFQAEWSAPSGFKNYAAKSNEISINYGGRANIGTATATATPEPTQEPTVVPTTAPTYVPTEHPTAVPTESGLPTPDTTALPVTELPTQAPTATPLSMLGCLGAFVIVLVVITHRKK